MKFEGSKRSTSEFEEEVVRTRTRFSVFELWYQGLVEKKALGRFDGWGPDVLDEVEPGHTVELHARCEVAPIQTLVHSFLWYAEKAKNSGHMFSVKGEELKELKENERGMRALLEGNGDDLVLMATPLGESGPRVGMAVKPKWLIGDLGRLGGEYNVVAQVDRVVAEGDEYPAIRMIEGVPPTPLEMSTMKEALRAFVEPAKGFELELTDNEATVPGPALWLDPIAICR